MVRISPKQPQGLSWPEGPKGWAEGRFTQHGKAHGELIVILDTSPQCTTVSKKNWVIAKSKQAHNKTPKSFLTSSERDEV